MTTNDITKAFINYLKNLDEDQRTLEVDEINEDLINEIDLSDWISLKYENKSNLKINETFLEELKQKLEDDQINQLYEYDMDYLLTSLVDDFLVEYFDMKYNDISSNTPGKETLYDYLNENQSEYIKVNTKTNKYFTTPILVDLLFDYNNLNREGEAICDTWYTFQEYYNDKENFDTKRFETNVDDFTKLLFKSQEYEFKDLFDDYKRENSKFLSSFFNELDNHYMLGVLTCVKKLRLNDIKEIIDKNNFVLKAEDQNNYAFGILDPTNGGGSMFEIELEKDFHIDNKYIYFSNSWNSSYGYSTASVYGELI